MQTGGNRVLVVDDDKDWVEFTRALLSTAGPFEIDWAPSATAAREMLRQREYDLYLVDYRLPGPDGLALLREFQKRNDRKPIIMVSGVGDDEVALEALKVGAAEYVDKQNLDEHRLIRAIQQARARSKGEGFAAGLESAEARYWQAAMERVVRLLSAAGAADGAVREVLRCLVPDVADLCALETWNGDRRLAIAYLLDGAIRSAEVSLQSYGRARSGLDPVSEPLHEPRLLREAAASRIALEFTGRVDAAAHLAIVGSAILAPLTIRGRSIGQLLVARQAARPSFMESDLKQVGPLSIALAATLENTTAQTRATVAEDRLRGIVDGMAAVLWEADIKPSRLTFVSRHCESMFGYPHREWLDVPDFFLDRVVEPDDRERVRAAHRRAASEGEPQDLDIRVRRADGSVRWVRELVQVATVSRGARALRGLLTDIDARKQREEAQAEREALYRGFFEASSEVMYVTSREGQILDVNQAALDVAGTSRDALLAQNVKSLYADPGDRDRFTAAVEQAGSIRNYEIRLRRKDGAIRTCRVSASVRRDRAGQPAGYQGVIRDVTDQKRAEDGREKALSILQTTLESTVDGIIVTGLRDLEVLALNRCAVQLWQIPGEILETRSAVRCVEWMAQQLVDAERAGSGLKRLLTDGNTERHDVLTTKDGRFIEVHSVSQGGEGPDACRVFSFRDVTETRRNELMLEAERRIFERIATDAGASEITAAVVQMVEGHIPGACCVCTTSPTAAPAMTTAMPTRRTAIVAASGEPLGEITVSAREEGVSFTPRELAAVDRATDLLRIALERLQAQKALQEAESKYRSLVEQSLVGVYIFQNDRFAYANPRLCEMWGYSRHDLLGVAMADLWSDESRQTVADQLRACLDQRVPSVEFAARGRRADGAKLEVYVYAGYTDYHGRPALIGTVLDVTEQRRLQAELAHAQRMETVGRLAGGVAHDFNNLLTLILGYNGRVLDRLRARSPERQDAEEVSNAARAAATLTRQLMIFSRKQALQPSVVAINAIVADARKLVEHAVGEEVELVVRLDEEASWIRVDPSQLVQVILNLAMNARDAMPRGGTLTMATRSTHLSLRDLRGAAGARPGPYAALSVTDTGVGMDERTRERLFEPFFTTKEMGKGTGLGLAVVYGIVKPCGGFVTVRSELGRGTTFDVYFPQCPPGTAQPETRGAHVGS